MGIGFSILIWLLGIIVLYLVIKAAINSSDMAYDIKVIRELLEKEFSTAVVESAETDTGIEDPGQPVHDAEDSVYTACPACDANLSGTEKECPECGLLLK